MQIVVANNVEAQYVEMMVPLYSYGCQRKIKNSLSHLKGIYSVNVDYKQHKVTVWGICNKHDVLATIKSKRKEARFWNIHEDNFNNDDDNHIHVEPSKPSFSMIRSRSLSFKAWRKVFLRSLSL
ncbi:Heavy metal transport/detoxification superfamily protein [Euphorbia peplus]|nr:Heavy metal transport/detoxification superfamily protein [Euphorbia peplus]